jgi:hypothetical protein
MTSLRCMLPVQPSISQETHECLPKVIRAATSGALTMTN